MKKNRRIVYSILLVLTIVCTFIPSVKFTDNRVNEINEEIVKVDEKLNEVLSSDSGKYARADKKLAEALNFPKEWDEALKVMEDSFFGLLPADVAIFNEYAELRPEGVEKIDLEAAPNERMQAFLDVILADAEERKAAPGADTKAIDKYLEKIAYVQEWKATLDRYYENNEMPEQTLARYEQMITLLECQVKINMTQKKITAGLAEDAEHLADWEQRQADLDEVQKLQDKIYDAVKDVNKKQKDVDELIANRTEVENSKPFETITYAFLPANLPVPDNYDPTIDKLMEDPNKQIADSQKNIEWIGELEAAIQAVVDADDATVRAKIAELEAVIAKKPQKALFDLTEVNDAINQLKVYEEAQAKIDAANALVEAYSGDPAKLNTALAELVANGNAIDAGDLDAVNSALKQGTLIDTQLNLLEKLSKFNTVADAKSDDYVKLNTAIGELLALTNVQQASAKGCGGSKETATVVNGTYAPEEVTLMTKVQTNANWLSVEKKVQEQINATTLKLGDLGTAIRKLRENDMVVQQYTEEEQKLLSDFADQTEQQNVLKDILAQQKALETGYAAENLDDMDKTIKMISSRMANVKSVTEEDIQLVKDIEAQIKKIQDLKAEAKKDGQTILDECPEMLMNPLYVDLWKEEDKRQDPSEEMISHKNNLDENEVLCKGEIENLGVAINKLAARLDEIGVPEQQKFDELKTQVLQLSAAKIGEANAEEQTNVIKADIDTLNYTVTTRNADHLAVYDTMLVTLKDVLAKNDKQAAIAEKQQAACEAVLVLKQQYDEGKDEELIAVENELIAAANDRLARLDQYDEANAAVQECYDLRVDMSVVNANNKVYPTVFSAYRIIVWVILVLLLLAIAFVWMAGDRIVSKNYTYASFANLGALLLIVYMLLRISAIPIMSPYSDPQVNGVIKVLLIGLPAAALFIHCTAVTNTKRSMIYVLCIALCALSLMPFWLMMVNATRNSQQIQGGVSLLPSTFLKHNWGVLQSKSFNVMIGFKNSAIIAFGSTILSVYFSALTAYGLTVYKFKGHKFLYAVILGIIMIPGQVTGTGFYMFMFQLGLTNNYLPLIIPAIASASTVFFFKQYLEANFQVSLVEAARIDGANEIYTYNRIVMPIMIPAMATMGIMAVIGSWNNYLTPLMLLSKTEMKTLPMMVKELRGDIYRTEYGSIYLGLTLTALPLLIVYFCLSKYIIAGVAVGGVKE